MKFLKTNSGSFINKKSCEWSQTFAMVEDEDTDHYGGFIILIFERISRLKLNHP